MEKIISMRGVSKVYRSQSGSVAALRGVGFDINRGEFAAVCGRSGCGKSTLLAVLGCLDMPDAGSYELDGSDALGCGERRRRELRAHAIGFVFQNYSLIPALTAQQNVELALRYAGVEKFRRPLFADAALRRTGIAVRAGHVPAEMSGGQQQRVAVARAIVTSPALLLADEPTGNLDAAGTREILALLRSLCAQGMTVVMITHDPLAAAAADRTIKMEDGRIAVS